MNCTPTRIIYVNIPGERGKTGANGANGPVSNGLSGISENGKPGELGISGVPGEDVPGEPGVPGENVPGEPGIPGEPGVPGENVPGEPGLPGENVPGEPGIPGEDVLGEPGVPGVPGVPGEPGVSGVPGTIHRVIPNTFLPNTLTIPTTTGDLCSLTLEKGVWIITFKSIINNYYNNSVVNLYLGSQSASSPLFPTSFKVPYISTMPFGTFQPFSGTFMLNTEESPFNGVPPYVMYLQGISTSNDTFIYDLIFQAIQIA